MKKSLLLVVVLFSTKLSFKAEAQIEIKNIEQIAKIKSSTTYIAMKDPESPKAKEYIEVFKKYWTFSKIEFIKYTDILSHLAPESSFLTIDGYLTNAQYQAGAKMKQNELYMNTSLDLELWVCNEKYFEPVPEKKKKKEKVFTNMDRIPVASIKLYADVASLIDPNNIYSSDYDAGGHIRNWSPGFLKNYLQTLMKELEKGEKREYSKELVKESELKELKTQILYVPDYVLVKFSRPTYNDSKKLEEKDVFKDYKLKYKLLPVSELSTLIMDESKPIYYLLYTRFGFDKAISVINSATGEIVYASYLESSNNLEPDELKGLQKVIQGK